MQLPGAEVKTDEYLPRGLWERLKAALPAAVGRFPPRLLSLLVFSAGLFLLVHALAYLATTLAPDGNTRFLQADLAHLRRLEQGAARIEALALGNSHTGALDMAALGFEHGYRFARADGDLFETRYYLEQLLPRLPRAGVVFVPLSYFSFESDNALSVEVELRRAHLYASVGSWRFLEGDFLNLLRGKSQVYFPVLSLVREDNWEGVFYALLGQPAEQKGFIEVEAGDCSSLTPEQMQASVENRVAKYRRLTGEMRRKNPALAEENYANVVAIQQLGLSLGRRVVFFTPPYLQAYSDHYRAQDGETLAAMRALVERLVREEDLEYYDFSQSPHFTHAPELYKDSDHLNACGMQQFSRLFRETLEKR